MGASPGSFFAQRHGWFKFPISGRCENVEKRQVKCHNTNVWKEAIVCIWVFPKIGIPQNGWFTWKTRLKWMIWGYHYFRKHPYIEFCSNFVAYHLTKKKQVDSANLSGGVSAPKCSPFFFIQLKETGSLDSKEQPQISKLMIQVFAFIMCIIFVDRKCILCKPNINKHVNLTCVGVSGLWAVWVGLMICCAMAMSLSWASEPKIVPVKHG